MECLNAEGVWRSLGGEREEDEKEDMGDGHCSITGSEWHRRAGYSTYERVE